MDSKVGNHFYYIGGVEVGGGEGDSISKKKIRMEI